MKIQGIGNAELNKILINDNQKTEGKGFSDILKNFIANVNSDLHTAKAAEQDIMAGKVDNLQQLMFQIEKSDISLRLITEIRNKALESYQEIIRMQV